ncbi:SMC5-SMC6 complex localization factor protein 1-like isoform X2 [Acanthaster planci]|uniref:SMC5-SMC6 complex localization factor protein 1-like isoform X2 n=1 Tax=Acanthaster planci TaxID=133434 RepID=A0A8B7ZFH1_ACAPL|nr:SMC5-SMC6 complex localization factor protein 1-like isoform X2 [Acanthaster planci]
MKQDMPVARRQSDRQQYRFLLSGFPDHEKMTLADSISRLGGRYLDSKMFVPECTHVVSVRPMRSEKYLCGCAAGKWIVTPEYIKASLAAGQWLEEEPYIWGNDKLADSDEPFSSMAWAPKRWRTHIQQTNRWAFSGWTVIILVTSNNNRPAVYKRLIECGGGVVLSQRLPIKEPDNLAKLLTYAFVDKCFEEKVRPLRERRVPCLAPEFIAEFLFEEAPNQEKFDIAVYKPEAKKKSSSENGTSRGADIARSSQASAVKTSKKGKNQRSQKVPLSQVSSSSESLVFTGSSQLSQHQSQSSQSAGSPSVAIARRQSTVTKSPLTQLTLTQAGLTKTNRTSASTAPSPGSTPWTWVDAKVNANAAVKRKLKFTSSQVQQTVAELKRKHAEGHYSRVPYWMQVQTPKYQDESVVGRPFPEVVSSLMVAYFEEDFWLKGVHSVHAHLSAKRYPPSSLMHIIMSKILESTDAAFKNHAVHVLKAVLCIHRPVTPEMSGVYLQSFMPATDGSFGLESDDPIDTPWDFIGSVIRRSLQRSGSDANDDADLPASHSAALRNSAEMLLGYIVALLEQDYQAFTYREENTSHKRKPRRCMLSGILWPNHRIKAFSPLVRQLITFLLRGVAVVEETPDMYPCLRMIVTLVEIAAECCRIFTRDSDILGTLQCGAHQDLAVEIASMAMQDGLADRTESLNILLSLLRPDWLKLKVTESLFSVYNDSLVLDENRSVAGKPLSLKKVVNYYFYLIPPTAKRTLSNVTPDDEEDVTTNPRKKKRQDKSTAVPLKTLAISNNIGKNRQLSNEKAAMTNGKVNRRNMRGETPLHMACIKNDPAKVRELLACSTIQVNMKDYAGWTALHEAANHGHLDCVKELLKYRPKQKITAYFASGNHKKYQDSLDLVAAPAECGTTPLHDAVNNGHREVARLLVQAGGKAVLMARNKAGLTPLDIAEDEPMKRALEPSGTDGIKNSEGQTHDQARPRTPSKRQCKDLPNPSPTEEVYVQVLGTMQNPKVYVTAEKCEQYCVLVCHLLQACLRTHKLVAIKAGLDHRCRLTDGSDGTTRQFQYEMTAQPSPGKPHDVSSQSLCSRDPSESGCLLMDDLTEMSNLESHLAGFVHHLGRIGPWVGTQRSNVCEKVIYDMKVLVETCL